MRLDADGAGHCWGLDTYLERNLTRVGPGRHVTGKTGRTTHRRPRPGTGRDRDPEPASRGRSLCDIAMDQHISTATVCKILRVDDLQHCQPDTVHVRAASSQRSRHGPSLHTQGIAPTGGPSPLVV